MFVAEFNYRRQKRKSVARGRKGLILDQRHWQIDEPGPAPGIGLPSRCIYAQNDVYLDLCNPGWAMQWRAVFGIIILLPISILTIWIWYGLAIQPVLFEKIQFFGAVLPYESEMWPLLWGAWLVFFPLAISAIFLIYVWFFGMGMRTCFFTLARGRIRFNRLTRKVYVLRPDYCGGSKIFEWEHLVALMSRVPEAQRGRTQILGSLVLYHAPRQADGSDEDAIYVGRALVGDDRGEVVAILWEYIRLYMQDGPSIDCIPANTPGQRQIPRYLAHDYFTYCGLPDRDQYRLEYQPGFTETTCHMLSQMTCTWPSFPKEWNSDSGLGEPEDRPVQTGAVMTALVYRAKGKLSKDDEVEFMRHWGTPEGLAEAMAR